jgi:hypothetical protein
VWYVLQIRTWATVDHHHLVACALQTKKASSSATTQSKPAAVHVQATVAEAKKKASAKKKAATPRKNAEGPVLGGADYVTIAMGGRRKAHAEAKKLPVDDD